MADAGAQTWTVLSLLNWTKDYFARAGLESPRLAAELLLAHVLGCKRIELYARFALEPGEQQRAAFRELVARAARHEPVAYLIGGKEFYSIWFRVTPDVLIPRPETEMLVSEALSHVRRLGRDARMLDACTGSGAVAVATASQLPSVHVLATDASPEAVEVAAGNAAAHGLGERVTCRTANLLELPDGCEAFSACDVVTANPPYVADADEVAESVRHEPESALRAGPEGLDVLRPLIAQAPERVAPGGALILEFGQGQADAVRDLIVATGAFDEPRILRDQQNIERTAVAAKQA